MDILYIVGAGSRWQNNELRYSLRSISKYGRNVRKVYISGVKPDWVSDEVIHIQSSDCKKFKHCNMLWKIQQAVYNSDISDEFLVSCDDHIYVTATDFDKYPFFVKDYIDRPCRHILPDESEPKRCDYIEELTATRKFLEKHNLPLYNFCPHNNIHFSKSIFKEMQPLVDESYKWDLGVEPMCLMLNYRLKYHPFEITIRKDLKFNGAYNESDMIKKIGKRECFSFSDSSIRTVGNMLKNMFPNKCKYEK